MTEFTSGYLREVTGDLDGPACTVCGAIMVPRQKPFNELKANETGKYFACLSCGETS